MFVFAAGVALALIVLLAMEFYNSRRVNKLTYPVYEYALKRAEEEANRIVSQARAEARALVESAEAESVKLTTAHQREDDAAQQAYQSALQALLSRFENQIKVAADTADEANKRISAEAVEALKAQAHAAQEVQAQSLQATTAEMAKRVDERFAAAFAAAEKEVAEYARARKDLIDARIFELIGETMKIVFQKNLPSEVHMQLVRLALEEAKANKVF